MPFPRLDNHDQNQGDIDQDSGDAESHHGTQLLTDDGRTEKQCADSQRGAANLEDQGQTLQT